MTGSSPLARGTLQRRALSLGCRRLIPARAGNTPPSTRDTRPPPAHPRSRGEHLSAGHQGQNLSGSSPLARGTRTRHDQFLAQYRLIPARAGNTWVMSSYFTVSPAHPRSRGEHTGLRVAQNFHNGSSPLARGTQHRTQREPCQRRLIPARAGNTR